MKEKLITISIATAILIALSGGTTVIATVATKATAVVVKVVVAFSLATVIASAWQMFNVFYTSKRTEVQSVTFA